MYKDLQKKSGVAGIEILIKYCVKKENGGRLEGKEAISCEDTACTPMTAKSI